MALARAEGLSAAGPPWHRAGQRPAKRRSVGQHTHQRFYSFSAQIQRERKDYYDQLERAQKGLAGRDPWLRWFLDCLLARRAGADTPLWRAEQSPVLATLAARP